MPRGVPNKQGMADTPPRKLSVTLHEADYVALEQLAFEQYRTPELQLAWLVSKVLSEAGRVPPRPDPVAQTASAVAHAQRIMERAAKANGS